MVSLLRFPLAPCLSVLLAGAALGAPGPAPDAPYHAYWLVNLGRNPAAESQQLLLTRGPLPDLARRALPAGPPLDAPAMTFVTRKRDALLSHPFRAVKQVGAVEAKAKTAVLDGKPYRYELCPLVNVIDLLNRPLLSPPAALREHPLRGFEQTTRAFTLLLIEQLPPATARSLRGMLPLDDRLWALEKPYDPDNLLATATRNQLARAKVTHPSEAEKVAIGYRIKHGGLSATEGGKVVGLIRVARRVPGFAEAGELVWIVRFIDMGGGLESISDGVTQELWISSRSAAVRPVLP